ncbi:Rho guanine nucleotide exchange factor scd1 [Fusarium agapanthi]|uniref:Rho guanine nucleotide exchange factor scd1 n=1 Tax=Fusarium agapanthi TaxID=1803897 RepID=A0A9P5BI94_9HYPO|nr:Rho guanine nucleotide exchange factor scd1 [Fusarium agapanthi]
MSDPLSVAASIAGLISITVEAVKFLSPYVSAANETPQIAAHVYSEIQSTQVILMGLQSLIKNLASAKAQHAALIGVNQVVTVLTDGVLLYSELHKELQSLRAKDGMEKVPLRGRLQWAWKESTFITLLSRLQSFKSSMTLVLMILQSCLSHSGRTAKEHQEQLSNNVQVLLDTNEALSRRIMNIENALDTQTITSRRTSILPPSASSPQDTTQPSISETIAVSIGTNNKLVTSKFDFEDDLESSHVYRRALRDTMDCSIRSSIARSYNWSVFSDLSLGDISVMSFIALPIYQDDITNTEHYDFGEEATYTSETPGPVMYQPLLVKCLEIKLKMLAIPGMQKYFDETPYPDDDPLHLWLVLRAAMPLLILAQGLGPSTNMNIDPPKDISRSNKKRIVLWFAQYCHVSFNIQRSKLITVEDLMGSNNHGFFRVISLFSIITEDLCLTVPLINHLSIVEATADAQPLELRKLLFEQRQFIQNLDELLEIRDRLEMGMKSILHNFRYLATLHIAFLFRIERNLFRSPGEQEWTPAFQFLLRNIHIEAVSHVTGRTARNSIEDWLRAGDLRDKDKITALLRRCLDLMPTRHRRVSALFAFSQYLKSQPLVSSDQIKDSNEARSALSEIVVQLQDDTESNDTDVAVEELKRRMQDWKGIDPDNLGELILSKTVFVVKNSKRKLD